MKLMHLSDLHIGKRLAEFSLLEDQRCILQQIVAMAADERPRAVIIAGDIYDRADPSGEAVKLFDDFLCALNAVVSDIFIISGNHDSPERLAFGARLIEASGVHISPPYDGAVKPVIIDEEDVWVNIYMLPFIRPQIVRRFFPETEISTYNEAAAAALKALEPDTDEINILAAHQFVTGSHRCDSEESAGGLDNIDAGLFAAFDYVALGHLHSPQPAGRPTLRYCGTPLKYSFSEAKDEKSVSFIEIKSKEDISLYTVPLIPRHDLREIRGSYEALTDKRNYEHSAVDDYLSVVLTDENDVFDAINKLRSIYPNIMKLTYDNLRTREQAQIDGSDNIVQKDPLTLFGEFYEKQNNAPMNENQCLTVTDTLEKIKGAAVCDR